MNIKSRVRSLVSGLSGILHQLGRKVSSAACRAFAVLRRFTRKSREHLLRLGRWIAGSWEMLGYYGVLAVVLIALGAAAYDYRTKGLRSGTAQTAPDAPEPAAAVQLQPDPTLPPEETAPVFILPLNGEVIGSFCDNTLIWSSAMQMWQTHPAIDISASAGEAVVAAADGTVIEAYSDPLYGNTIAIDHGGCILRYASLNTLQLVSVGQYVQQGEVISAAGICASESELGAHLHLECYIDQNATDYCTLLK